MNNAKLLTQSKCKRILRVIALMHLSPNSKNSFMPVTMTNLVDYLTVTTSVNKLREL